MEQRDVQRQLLGDGHRLLDALHRLAGQADNKVAPVLNAGLLGPAQRAVGLLHLVALVRPLKDQLIAALDAPGDQGAAGAAHQP